MYDYLFYKFYGFQLRFGNDPDLYDHSAIIQLSLIEMFNVLAVLMMFRNHIGLSKENAVYLLESKAYVAILVLPLVVLITNYRIFKSNDRYKDIIKYFDGKDTKTWGSTFFWCYLLGSFAVLILSIFIPIFY